MLLPAICSIATSQQPQSASQTGSYHIHPGDQIEVNFRLTPEFDQTLTVQPDGYITLQSTGPLIVGNKTLAEVTELIKTKSSNLLRSPEVSVILKDFQHPYFVVAGEVEKPGRYDMREPTTALQAILLAGGMKNTARSNQVIIYRRINETEAEVHVLDLRTIKTLVELATRDQILVQGDMLLVPRSRFSVVERVVKLANLGVYFNPAPTF